MLDLQSMVAKHLVARKDVTLLEHYDSRETIGRWGDGPLKEAHS